MKTRIALILTPFLLLAGLAAARMSATPNAPQKPADTVPAKAGGMDTKIIAFQKPSYPLDTCPISHEKLGSMGEPVDMVVDGKLVRLCCGSCKKGVEKDKAAIVKLIDAAVIEKQSVGYPMENCALCAQKMTTPINKVVGTRLVRLCCDECVKTYDADATKSSEAMTKLNTAWVSSQKGTYALTTCAVCAHPIDDKAIDHLYGTRLVRLCSKECVTAMEAKPEPALAKLNEKKTAPTSTPKTPPDKKG